MLAPDMRDAEHAVMPVMTEQELAEWRRSEGAHVIYRRGRYWEETHRGFYQAIHWLARLRGDEAKRPTPWCWGYRTSLHEDNASAGQNSLPVHLLSDVADYDMAAIGSKRRNQLRKCRNLVQFVEIKSPRLLEEQGYEVVASSKNRTGYSAAPTKEGYCAGVARFVATHRGLILAGLIDGRLGGYLCGTAVGQTAYIDHVFIADEALPTQIGTGLVFDFVQACRRSEKVREVVYGQHSREDSALARYKEKMLFPVVHVPAKLVMFGPARIFVRRQRPDVYYRLTGKS